MALYDFLQHHQIDMDAYGNAIFSAIVDYDSSARSVVTTTEIRFVRNGYDDGKVALREQPEMQADDYHLDLSARYQSYRFDGLSGKLTITGNSSKMGGVYTIKISADENYV